MGTVQVWTHFHAEVFAVEAVMFLVSDVFLAKIYSIALTIKHTRMGCPYNLLTLLLLFIWINLL